MAGNLSQRREFGRSRTNNNGTRREIVVVGTSAGGIEALAALVGGLPSTFPAALLVVMHIPPTATSRLPQILTRAGPLPAKHGDNGEPIEGGQIYVAPPDLHMTVNDGRIELQRGPRENHSRPAIDPLFRSASRAYGNAAIGVVLSGALFDGAAGLLALAARGGLAIVQEPTDATVDAMPRNALSLVKPDHVLPAAEIGPLLGRLVCDRAEPKDLHMVDSEERIRDLIREDITELGEGHRTEELTIYTCPDCGGSMWQTEESLGTRFVCHVGHAYGPEFLVGQKADELEGALWACVRLFTEKATLTRQVAMRSQAINETSSAARLLEQAEADERRAQLIREMLSTIPQPVG